MNANANANANENAQNYRVNMVEVDDAAEAAWAECEGNAHAFVVYGDELRYNVLTPEVSGKLVRGEDYYHVWDLVDFDGHDWTVLQNGPIGHFY